MSGKTDQLNLTVEKWYKSGPDLWMHGFGKFESLPSKLVIL